VSEEQKTAKQEQPETSGDAGALDYTMVTFNKLCQLNDYEFFSATTVDMHVKIRDALTQIQDKADAKLLASIFTLLDGLLFLAVHTRINLDEFRLVMSARQPSQPATTPAAPGEKESDNG